MNKTGCLSWFGYVLPLEVRLDMVRDAGFSSTTLMYDETSEFFIDGRGDLIPELMKKRGLYFENIHAPFVGYNKIWSQRREEREEIEKVFFKCIDYCGKHGIPVLVIHITEGPTPPEPDKYGLEFMKNLVHRAEDAGVSIAVENTRKEDHLEYIFSSITSPALGFCYDSGHDFLYSRKPGAILKKWGHLLLTTHFSDNDGRGDNHWLPGEGIIDWNKITENFPKNYKGVISLEAFAKEPEKGDGPSFLKKAFEIAGDLRDRIFSSACSR